tara:strand:- start:225 stop:389 length:165 start_codon:yes stop_codon:yes gene_type:complete
MGKTKQGKRRVKIDATGKRAKMQNILRMRKKKHTQSLCVKISNMRNNCKKCKKK